MMKISILVETEGGPLGMIVVSPTTDFLKQIKLLSLNKDLLRYRLDILDGKNTIEPSKRRFDDEAHRERISIRFSESENQFVYQKGTVSYRFYNLIEHTQGFVKIGESNYYPNQIIASDTVSGEVESYVSLTDSSLDSVVGPTDPRRNFFIGNKGHILRVRYLKNWLDFNATTGYRRSKRTPYFATTISLINGDKVVYSSHYLTAAAFSDNRFVTFVATENVRTAHKSLYVAHHINGNKYDSSPDNLILLPFDLHNAIHRGDIFDYEDELDIEDLNYLRLLEECLDKANKFNHLDPEDNESEENL